MSPVEQGGRHYVGPEQPKAPPMPTLPPAAELLRTPPDDIDDAPTDEDPGHPGEGNDIRGAFLTWIDQRCRDDENPAGIIKVQALLEEAFRAGWTAAARQGIRPRAADLPLEGTVESRTIVAALEMFKEQILIHNPEEVKTGEWLNARDVEVLIQGIRANAAKGR